MEHPSIPPGCGALPGIVSRLFKTTFFLIFAAFAAVFTLRMLRSFLRDQDSRRWTAVLCMAECRKSREFLERILLELLTPEAVAASGGVPWRLCRIHGGNLRMVLRQLYDHFADTSEVLHLVENENLS